MRRISRRPSLALMTGLACSLALMVSLAPASLARAGHGARLSRTSSSTDWPTYLHDVFRTSANLNETILSPANAGQLKLLWSLPTGGPIEASATVVSGTLYVGSWDGYEYALDPATGALKWKTFLNRSTTPAGCNGPWPVTAGVSSSAAVYNGILYVGGGGNYWYALNAATGAKLWRVYTGDSSQNQQTGGHYNWSSPLIYRGYAYINIASAGNCPSVQGQLLQVNLSTHKVVHTFNVVPTGQVGGALWSSPAVDPATNTIYVSTGSPAGGGTQQSQPYTYSILALDATTLALKGNWQIPAAQNQGDSDFGATPTLFTDASGRQLVGAANKNGLFYALDRTNVGAGPAWEDQVATGGGCPQCGQGSIAPAAFANGTLYVAGGSTSINGQSYQGAVRALDPSSGTYRWEHGSPGVVLGAVAYANGLAVDGAGATLEVLDASTGATLFSDQTSTNSQVFLAASPTIVNGEIIEGSSDGTIYAFGVPGTLSTRTP